MTCSLTLRHATWLFPVLCGLVGCATEVAGGECSSNQSCAAGEVCIDGSCARLCRSDRDCGGNDCSGSGRICDDGVCLPGCRDTAPEILSLDGTGTADSGTDPRGTKALHRVRDLLVIAGRHLQGSDVALTPLPGTPVALSVLASGEAEIQAELPAGLVEGWYTLTVANGIGEDQAGVFVLQGEPQTAAGVLALLQSLGNPVSGLYAESASVARALTDGDGTPRTYTEIVTPPGAVFYFASDTCPGGYLPADGTLVSRSAHVALFTAIGTRFGAGDGTTTFALPDLRGEFVRGWDGGRGADPGRAMGTAQAHDWKSFTVAGFTTGDYVHADVLIPKSGYNTTYPFGGYWSAPGNLLRFSWDATSEIRPRNVALLACIKR